MKPFRIRIDVNITARDREQAERRAGLLYSDLEHGRRPWVKAVLPDGIEDRKDPDGRGFRIEKGNAMTQDNGQPKEPKAYIDYQVRSFTEQPDGKTEPCVDEHATLFCIFGQLPDSSWEWIEDVPTREAGFRRISWMPIGTKQADIPPDPENMNDSSMTAKHSPAPWSYEYSPYRLRRGQDGIESELPAFEVFDADCNKLFDTNEDTPCDIQEENARIASSAPRLLASLVRCAKLLADYDESDGPEGEAYREALSVITEATGAKHDQ